MSKKLISFYKYYSSKWTLVFLEKVKNCNQNDVLFPKFARKLIFDKETNEHVYIPNELFFGVRGLSVVGISVIHLLEV